MGVHGESKGPDGPSPKKSFVEGCKIGLVQFGVPAMVGLLIPSHPYVGGALAGAAVVTGRAGGFVRENLGATISGALIGALAGHAGARFGLTGALAAAGIGALVLIPRPSASSAWKPWRRARTRTVANW